MSVVYKVNKYLANVFMNGRGDTLHQKADLQCIYIFFVLWGLDGK